MLICLTCANFSKRDTTNQRLFLGRCLTDDVSVMICRPGEGVKEACDNYEVAPDAKDRIAFFKEWEAKHPTPVYKMTPGMPVGTDERPKPVKRPKRKKK
jgi:hypothetical protein